MIWLLRDFDLLSVLLKAASLAFEALSLGGVAYLLVVLRGRSFNSVVVHSGWRALRAAALCLAIAEISYVAIDSAILMFSSGLGLRVVFTASYFVAGSAAALSALGLVACAKFAGGWSKKFAGLFAALILVSVVSTSHAFSRLDHRGVLIALTAAHHFGMAAWIGAMPFLLITLRKSSDLEEARQLVKRYSAMALAGAATLLAGGTGMAWFYLGATTGQRWEGLYGTAYGMMLLAKVYLFCLIITLGAANFFLVRTIHTAPAFLLTRLRRFGEVEIGLGFTAILAAASMISQPPAIDLQQRVKVGEIVQRMAPEWPRLSSPPVSALVPPSSLREAVHDVQFSSGTPNDANDQAWSEYNHHWAGLIVLIAGTLALLSRLRGWGWARAWPLVFAALAVFIVLRADPENWPLGPRSFWASFSAPDVLQHRFYALLILGFALFEWGVEAGWLRSRHAAMVFPLLCAAGGALLLTHNHSLGNVKDELLVDMTHTPVALLGATAGWSRWLELRLPNQRQSRVASYAWPVCLMLVGLVLLDYRES